LKNIYSILFFCVILTSCSKDNSTFKSENIAIDSVKYWFSKSEKNKTSLKEKIKYLNKVKSIIQNSSNTLSLRELNYDLITKYYDNRLWENYKIAAELLKKNSIASADIINLAKSYRSFGNYFEQVKVIDSSFYYYTKSEKIYEQLRDYEGYSTILLKKGIIQFYAGDYLGSDLSLSKSLVANKKTSDKIMRYNILNQLGLNSNQLKDYNESINYFNKALIEIKKNEIANNFHEEAICLSNIGLVYQNLKNHNKAIEYFDKSLKDITLKVKLPDVYSNIIDNKAYSKLKINDLTSLPNLFFESLAIRKKTNDSSAIIISYIHISEYYYYLNLKDKALEYANSALDLSRINKNPIDILFSLKQGSVVDNTNASKYSEDYLKISDSLQIVERNSKDRFARIQFGTQEIIQEKDILEDKNRSLLYGFAITFILVALLFIVRAQRAKTRELLFKQTQQKANEEIFNLMMLQQSIIDESRYKEKKRLAQDLHDGVLGRMFGLRLNLDSLNSNTDADAATKRAELLNELKIIEQDIREISHDLNREKLVLINNFVSIVHNLLEEQKSFHDSEVIYHIDPSINWDKIENAIKINMYRILQEGLQNINKYASAKNITIEISGNTENVAFLLKDDGIGFDVNKKSKGIGMQNMITRTSDCQGKIEIISAKGDGTRIEIQIPINTIQLLESEA